LLPSSVIWSATPMIFGSTLCSPATMSSSAKRTPDELRQQKQ
jgi:hypothetical protein